MRLHTVVVALASAVFATTAVAQPASSPSGAARTSGSSERQASESKASYGTEDCLKDMANAKDAKQAGHITEKELAEQKKMAQTKMKRDSGQSASAITGGDCK